MAGKLTINAVQLGDSSTASQNFVLQTNVDGTAKLSRGNLGATSQDIFTIDAAGKLILTVIPAVPAQSMIRVATSNGFGSTATAIRRFSTLIATQGTDITYVDSVTLGGTFTINVNGVYGMSYSQNLNSTGQRASITLNSTSLTASPINLANAQVLAIAAMSAASYVLPLASTVYLQAGDIVRAQDDAPVGVLATVFSITRVA